MTAEQQLSRSSDATRDRPLSANEEFLYAFDRGDDLGVFGPRGLVPGGRRLRGQLNTATVQLALNDLVARHEALRTRIIRDEDAPYARVYPPGPVDLDVVDLPPTAGEGDRERRTHEFFNQIDRTAMLAANRMPLVQAILGRFDDEDAVLVLVTHHTVSDGWSMQVLLRDFAICYAMRRALPAPELPVMRQYGEYVSWQQQTRQSESAATAREYWQTRLAGGSFITVPTDRPRQLDVPPVYSVYRFLLDQELAGATASLARSVRSSSFIILFACFNLFLHRRTGVDDIVSPIIASGRMDPEFEQTVGPLFNFLPIRTNLSACATFADLVHRTRAALLEAYSYERPFNEIIAQSEPELMQGPTAGVNSVVTAFQISQFPPEMEAEQIGDVRYSALRRNLISSDGACEIPDGSLWDFDLDPAGDVVGLVKFNSRDYNQSTIIAMVDEYRELLRASLKSPSSALLR